MTTANLFGNRLFLPVDVISLSDVTISFDKANTSAVCDSIDLIIQRGIGRVIDLSSGDAIGTATLPQGRLICTGVILPSRSPVSVINAYVDICDKQNPNTITLYFYSECNDDVLKITAKGCILELFSVRASQQGIMSIMQFFVGGVEIDDNPSES